VLVTVIVVEVIRVKLDWSTHVVGTVFRSSRLYTDRCTAGSTDDRCRRCHTAGVMRTDFLLIINIVSPLTSSDGSNTERCFVVRIFKYRL